MAQSNHTPRLSYTEEALTVLFCLVDDALTPNSTPVLTATSP
jgi:hypothetical protein